MKNLVTKNKKELEWTKEKYKLVELIADMPGDAEETYNYLYGFIAFGMLNGKFSMSCGHQEELEKWHKEYEQSKKQIGIGEAKGKMTISLEEKRMNEYICEIVRLATEIRNLNREEILRYIFIIMHDIATENGIA